MTDRPRTVARQEARAGVLFCLPAAVYVALFSGLPMLAAAWLSLHDWNLLKAQRPFVGLANFAALAADPFFRNAIYNSLLFAGLAAPLGVATALAVAVLVSQPLRGVGLFRTLFFVPAVSSPVAVSMVWIWVLLPEVGLINTVLAWLGAAGGTDFLNDTRFALPALVAMFAWIGLGPRMVIFLAGLQAIPQALQEAADLDGAGPWQRFRHVTLPLLLPTTLFVFVTTTIAAFQTFTPVYIMTRGGPRRTTDVVAYHIFKEAWQNFELGLASAQTYVLFAIVAVAAAAQFWLMRRGLREESA